MSELPAEPAVRADGLCVVCLEPRLARKLKPVYQGAAESDPFCSNTCARLWYGTAIPQAPRPASRAYVETLPKTV